MAARGAVSQRRPEREAAEKGGPEQHGGGAIDREAPADAGDQGRQERAEAVDRDVHEARGARGLERLTRLVQHRPDQADRERDGRGGARRQIPAPREGSIPECREHRIFGQMPGLAREPVQGVELQRRRPWREHTQEGHEPVLGVLGAAQVGRERHDRGHPEGRREPVLERHAAMIQTATPI